MGPFIREVLRLWPQESDLRDPRGEAPALKKKAWVEGLPNELFTNKPMIIQRVHYDAEESHTLELRATIFAQESHKEGDAPYRLETSWKWAPSSSSASTRAV